MLYKRKINNIEFVYSSTTGKVYKAIDGGYIQVGTKAYASGYYETHIPGSNGSFKLHRLIWYIVHGIWSTNEQPIDHINRNKLDNKLSNLRQVTASLNALNKDTEGVSWCNTHKVYRVRIQVNKKRISLGTFKTKKEALDVAQEARKKYL